MARRRSSAKSRTWPVKSCSSWKARFRTRSTIRARRVAVEKISVPQAEMSTAGVIIALNRLRPATFDPRSGADIPRGYTDPTKEEAGSMQRALSALAWTTLGLLGAGALGAIALQRGEPVNGIWFVLAAASSYLLAYRFY